ncbi:MFS transporter [Oceanobacillus bengalensis]|uniref:MFS transporter n=2 Tax=Oceanobacillus bengalensis TaxID=1435466 RepID=A0A494Z2A7_9BACI|nr:MFS transporter [Oceanobacillus bengalensis]
MFLTMTGYGIVLPTLPFIADDLGLTSFQMGTLITGWAASQLITAPLWGRFADKIGRKPVLIFGLFGFGIAFLILIFAQNYWQLLIARIIGAALSSGTHPAVFSMVADFSNKKDRNISIAKMGALNGLGFLCGPAVGGIFTPLGVMVPFIVAGSLALVTLPLAWLYIKEPVEKDTQIGDDETLSLWSSILMVTKTGYWNLYTITLGLSLAASSFFGLLGYFMIARFDASAIFVSLAFSAQAGVSVLVQFFLLKKIYEVWDEEKISKVGLVITTIGYSLIALAPMTWIVILGCIFTGFGQACVRPTVISLLSKREEMGQGITMGLQQSMDSLGRILGPLWGGWIFSVFVPGPFLTSALITLLLFIIVIVSSEHRLQQMPRVREKSSRM